MTTPLLLVDELSIEFPTEAGWRSVVDHVSFSIQPGEVLGLVGESGSGKSLTALSLLGLLPQQARVASGSTEWRGTVLDDRQRERLRGSKVTLVNQDAVASLDPLVTVGRQLIEVLRRQQGLGRRAAATRAAELLDLVGIGDVHRRLDQHPWELSGGMVQRVVIALALAPEPELLIADEPTTALDVTVQAQVLALIARLQRELGLAVLLITHDLGVVAGLASRIAVMYSGRIVEVGDAVQVFRDPSHPYTEGLMSASPDPFGAGGRLKSMPGSAPLGTHHIGCSFQPRCVRRSAACDAAPVLGPVRLVGPSRSSIEAPVREVACWHAC